MKPRQPKSKAPPKAAPTLSPEVKEQIDLGQEAAKGFAIREADLHLRKAVELGGGSPEAVLAAADVWRRNGWFAVMAGDDPETGWFMMDRARSLYRRLGPPGQATAAQAERGMAIAESRMGRLRDSLLCCARAEALTTDPAELAKIWNTRATTHSYLGEHEAARAYAEKALEIVEREAKRIPAADRTRIARNARQNVGMCRLMGGEPERALDFLEDKVLRAWARLECGQPEDALALEPAGRPRIHVLKARALVEGGRADEAEAELLRAEALFEEARAKIDSELDRAGFRGSGLAREANDLLVSMAAADRPAEAFLRSERGRARSFLEFAVDGRKWSEVPARPSERRRHDDLREEMQALERKARRSPAEETRLEHVRHEFVTAARSFEKERLAEDRVQPREPMGEAEIRERLGEGEALLEFHEAGNAIHRFFLDRGSFRQSKIDASELLEEARDLAEVVMLARRGERQGAGGFFGWHFGMLGRALLEGIPLKGISKLVLAPHGVLNLVPFPALKVGDGYLVEKAAVSLAPSASVHVTLAGKAAGAPEPRTCLWIRDPTRTLSHVAGEERALRDRFGARLTVLAGREATPEAVLEAAPRHDALHFTTHAVFRPERPELSYLEMADRRKLFAFDLMLLDLSRVRVAAISACESGRGDFAHANEMVGLPRAFLRAGACSVLATLWPLEDHAAIGTLMAGFYRALGPKTPSEALQAAQVECIGKALPATVWAAFALFGA